MAKKTKSTEVAVVEKKKSTAVALTAGANAPPSALAKTMAKDSGKGVSTDASDNVVPLVYILHQSSPQCLKNKPEYIKGAEAGMIWLRNSAEPLVDGEEGILVQPCHFSKGYVEWMPNRGGFVARHDSLPADVKEVPDDQNPNRKKFVRKNKNEIIETRYHVVRIFTSHGVFPYVIPFKSTGHTVSRQWMFLQNSMQLPDGGKAPSWAKLYRLTTKHKSNNAGDWHLFEVTDAGWVPDEENYMIGKALYEAFSKGEKSYEAEHDAGGDDSDGAM